MKLCRKKIHFYPKEKKFCPMCREVYVKKNSAKIKADHQEWIAKNKEKIKLTHRIYYKKNKAKVHTTNSKWRIANKAKCNAASRISRKKREISNPLTKLRSQLRTLIRNTINGGGFTKKSKTALLLGCSFVEVRDHLIKTAILNYGFYNSDLTYHIDHIVPSSFGKTEEALIKLQHYTNLQYLTATDNTRKSNKYDGTRENISWKIIECESEDKLLYPKPE